MARLFALPRELVAVCCRSPLRRQLHASARLANVLAHLEQRGMLHDLTSRAARTHVDKPTTVYLGLDPSAPSLHVGNLLALIGLLHFTLHGHNAIALVGGATGAVGDPSGRSTERNALPAPELARNIASITDQVSSFFARGAAFAASRSAARYPPVSENGAAKPPGKVVVKNNLDWLGGIGLLDFLRTVGKSARMATMLSRDSVKSRLDSSSGLSFTEFTYQLLQAFDFLTLHRRHNCTVQLGGSDQLGNILSGIELIRKSGLDNEKAAEDPAYGVTMPLLTTATGEKFGKSAGNAVWLDPYLTSPFEFYQFFLRTTDDDVLKYLKIFSFIPLAEVDNIMQEHQAHPNRHVAQKVLAAEATELIHGPAGLRQALVFTHISYQSDLSKLDIPAIVNALDGAAPSMLVRLDREVVLDKPLKTIITASGLLPSNNQAMKAIEAGMIHVNGRKIPAKSHERVLETSDLLGGGLVVLRASKTAHKAVLVS